jgi:hypothetical protein
MPYSRTHRSVEENGMEPRRRAVVYVALLSPLSLLATFDARSDFECLSPAEVSSTVGLQVIGFPQGTRPYDGSMICAYQAVDAKLGTFVTTVAGPAGGGAAEKLIAKMRESVKVAKGSHAELEVIPVGDRGYAYGSKFKSAAASVTGERVYQAEIVSSAAVDVTDKKIQMTALVKRLMVVR